jgi:hypothetical protein
MDGDDGNGFKLRIGLREALPSEFDISGVGTVMVRATCIENVLIIPPIQDTT